MAEDAGIPYYGSYMSLMTHGGVRYEGVLTSVDMANSTLRLSNGEWVDSVDRAHACQSSFSSVSCRFYPYWLLIAVRCMGTEGRAEAGQEIPASNQIFETVQFNGKCLIA